MEEKHGHRAQRVVEGQLSGCLGWKSLKTLKQLRMQNEKNKVTRQWKTLASVGGLTAK